MCEVLSWGGEELTAKAGIINHRYMQSSERHTQIFFDWRDELPLVREDCGPHCA